VPPATVNTCLGTAKNIVIHACKNITEKNEFVENVWPANLAVFIYVYTLCATVK